MPAGSPWAMLGLGGILLVTVLYPLLLLIYPRNRRQRPTEPSAFPTVAVITAARNAAALIDAKLRNLAQLDYPAGRLSGVFASDASTDDTGERVRKAAIPGIRLVEQSDHAGKAAALNRAVAETDAELLLFSDADALLAPDAVRKLVRHFADPAIGGVCGQRMIAAGGQPLREAQQRYIDLDSRLKRIESDHGRVTSNDGKIHMIRRILFRPIPGDVTDDLYTALSVIGQGFRFVFEPEAIAAIGPPSRDARHEIRRRRRIVTRSLTGIFRMRRVLNPLTCGLFALGLLLNKVGRRLLPFFLLAIMAGLLQLCAAAFTRTTAVAVAAIVLAVGIVLSRAALPTRPSRLMRSLLTIQYALAGLIGTAWGVLEFLAGRRVCAWDPLKTPAGQTEGPR